MLSDVIVYHIFADESLSVSLRPLHLPSLNNTRIQKNRQKLISFHSPPLIYSSFSSSTLVVYAIASICCAKSDFSKTPYNGERKKKKLLARLVTFENGISFSGCKRASAITMKQKGVNCRGS